MFERSFEVHDEKRSESHLTLRDIAAILLRQRVWVAATFIAVVALFLVAGFLFPSYESETAILVRRDRSDRMVSSQENAPPNLGRGDVTEEELNSEVELIKSPDLRRQAVLALGLQNDGGFLARSDPEPTKIAKAIRHLSAGLTVKPLQKTNVISVRYDSANPQTAQRVLVTLNRLYLEKHMQVNRPIGEFALFDKEAEQYRKNLNDAEALLIAFTRRTGVSAPQVERDLALKNLADAQVNMKQVKASVAEVQQRISELQSLQASVPDRHVTIIKTADNPQLLEQMKSKLLELELERLKLRIVSQAVASAATRLSHTIPPDHIGPQLCSSVATHRRD